MKPTIKINLSDNSLFGNDAAELEQEAVFSSYALRRTEVNYCLDQDVLIGVIRAYKGEGKSSILRILKEDLSSTKENTLIYTIGPDIAPNISNLDHDEWVRAWKKNIEIEVVNELGKKIDFAFTDDAISIVEAAERTGSKSRSWISTIFDRIKPKNLQIDITKPDIKNHEALLERYLSGRAKIWVLIDDIDQNFANTEINKIKIASFFTACRHIIRKIPEIRFRLSVRPNVWAILHKEFESLTHINQYVIDLKWSQDDFNSLLAARIFAYANRTGQGSAIKSLMPQNRALKEINKWLISLVFEGKVPWGKEGKEKEIETMLYTLARQRPRWLIELCKKSAKATCARAGTKINYDDIKNQLDEFGRARIFDTCSEFKSQCPQIEDIIQAFSGKNYIYSTAELLTFTKNNITNLIRPKIEGAIGTPTELDIAHFLFQIGFITARRDYGDGDYDHVSFFENPMLLKSKANTDEGMKWEIHPVFREVLHLKREATPRRAKRTGVR